MHKLFASAAITAFAISQSAVAQDTSATPHYGTVQLSSGFTPDPHVIQVMSGGMTDASDISSDCRGYISNAPDVRLRYSAGDIFPLILTTRSDSDLTMVVNAPDGRWYCNDDGGEGLNPLLRFDSPRSGNYEIWIGTYGEAANREASLIISELDSGSSSANSSNVMRAVPTTPTQTQDNDTYYGEVRLSAGFTPDPHLVRVQAGGSQAASNRASGCMGNIGDRPDFRLNYTSGTFPLYISADSMADTTLVVRAPNGSYYCDDDSGEGLNPRVWMQNPMSGNYDIWVGTFGVNEFHSAELNISELYSE